MDVYSLSPHYKAIRNYGDANACEGASATIYLRGPDRSDWSMCGNAGTTPGVHYLGTPDNKDVVFKSNGQERLRLTSSGEVKVNSLLGTGDQLLNVDANGIMKRGAGGGPPQQSDIPWYLGGNNDVATSLNRIGPTNSVDFIQMTNNIERMRITTVGRVGIGTTAPAQQFDVATADESGGMNLTNIRSDANAHTEIRFMKGTDQRWGLGCDFEKDGGQDFFLWDHQALSKRLTVDAHGRVLIGGDAVPGPNLLYKLYVEGGIVSRDMKVTAQAFPDYVFAPNYDLMALDEFEQFLNTAHHLPGFPSAAEVEADGGFELGDMSTRLLKLAEEQSLYIVQLNKEVHELKRQVANIEAMRSK